VRALGRVSPVRWAYEYSRLVREVQSELAGKAAPAPAPRTRHAAAPLAPSTRGSSTVPSANDYRDQMVEAIMSGDLDNLPDI
jgi:hypothetical protein